MTPGELFAKLWSQIDGQAGAIISVPWPGKQAREHIRLKAILSAAETFEVPQEIEDYLAGGNLDCICDASPDKLDQRAFVVMCALDSVAIDIHPSISTRAGGKAIVLSPLLTRMKQVRTVNGVYGEHGGWRTIPKGRLSKQRGDPEVDWASGANLETQFEYLTVLNAVSARYSVKIEVVPPRLSPLSGPPKTVGLAPIAEDADDLAFTPHKRGGRPYLDARPRDVDLLQTRLINSVTTLLDRGAELIVLPELVVPQETADVLATALKARPTPRPEAMIVCGSGLTTMAGDTGLHFNEAVVLNGYGLELFRQRKIHPFNMGNHRMRECGIPFADGCENRPHMEDIEPCTEIMVRDLTGVGRTMVAICEDLEQFDPIGDTVMATRPDWVITPVLDISQKPGRWTHQRSIELGRKTGAQFVVSCSASLTVRMEKAMRLSELSPGQMGLGMLYAGDSRRVKIVDASEDVSMPRTLVIDWKPDDWLGDNVTTVPRNRSGS